MTYKELEDNVRADVAQAGYPVYMNTPFCADYLSKHDGCKGCESEHGCSRMCKILSAASFINDKLKDSQDIAEIFAGSMALADLKEEILRDGAIKQEPNILAGKGFNDLI